MSVRIPPSDFPFGVADAHQIIIYYCFFNKIGYSDAHRGRKRARFFLRVASANALLLSTKKVATSLQLRPIWVQYGWSLRFPTGRIRDTFSKSAFQKIFLNPL